MTLADIERTLAAHRALLDHVALIIADSPWCSDNGDYSAENDGELMLSISGDEAVVSWLHNGFEDTEKWEAKFPASLLLATVEEMEGLRAEAQREEAEREERDCLLALDQAQERQEARDRAEYARLLAKFGPPHAEGTSK
jgi:hypothetical protein